MTKKLETCGFQDYMVVCRFVNDDYSFDDHAFVMKKTEQGGWVLLDSAETGPLYTNPMPTG